jgi:hypothetical protein
MSTVTTNERSGEIPDDLSAEAGTVRHKRIRIADCHGTEVPEAWTHPSFATLDEQLARIATIQGDDAAFATSLVQQFTKTGKLSPKQLAWVGRLYRKYADKVSVLRSIALNHDWRQVGSITHYANHRLGTYSGTDYHKCVKCGEWGETYESNNYSGD